RGQPALRSCRYGRGARGKRRDHAGRGGEGDMATTTETGIAIIGCGYVADSYRHCLPLHTGTLRLTGAYDRDPQRLAAYKASWGDRAYASLDEVLADETCSIVLNLTDPESHAAVTE